MTSDQTLSETDRRTLARWASVCAAHVLALFSTEDDAASEVIHDALQRAGAFGRGESTAATEIRMRMLAVKAAGAATTAAGAAAGRSVAQASAVAHLGAHALGAAAYAVKAVALAHADQPELARDEVRWQLAQLTAEERAALRRVPPIDSVTSGPLGPGLLSRGALGQTIREIQASLSG